MLRVSHETVTTDGVLLLSSSQGEPDVLTPEGAIARMSVVVADEDVELSGTNEQEPGFIDCDSVSGGATVYARGRTGSTVRG